MADKIDQLKVGSTSYDIDLPPDAEIYIKKLTIGASGGYVSSAGYKVQGASATNFFNTNGSIIGNNGSLPLSPGSNISMSISGDVCTISGATTWVPVTASTPGYLYRYSVDDSITNVVYGRLQITSAVELRFAIGRMTGLARNANAHYSFKSGFFSTPPVVSLGYRHDSTYIAETVEIDAISATGFTIRLNQPSGTGTNSANKVEFIAIEPVGTLS